MLVARRCGFGSRTTLCRVTTPGPAWCTRAHLHPNDLLLRQRCLVRRAVAEQTTVSCRAAQALDSFVGVPTDEHSTQAEGCKRAVM